MAGVRENCHKVYCFQIYPREDGHITEINVLNNKNLGSRAQLCAAFYHVCNSPCLDVNCIVENQPRKVVALVKFEDASGDLVYQARYTNCYVNKNHAENFFDCDIRHGVLTDKVENILNHDGTITLYLTYQPCNKSTVSRGTRPNQSCCDILKSIYFDILQPKGIRLRIKITHALRLGTGQLQDVEERLRQKARAGIQELINSGITVSGMEKNDWKYLFSMIHDDEETPKYDRPRQDLDRSISETLQTFNLP